MSFPIYTQVHNGKKLDSGNYQLNFAAQLQEEHPDKIPKRFPEFIAILIHLIGKAGIRAISQQLIAKRFRVKSLRTVQKYIDVALEFKMIGVKRTGRECFYWFRYHPAMPITEQEAEDRRIDLPFDLTDLDQINHRSAERSDQPDLLTDQQDDAAKSAHLIRPKVRIRIRLSIYRSLKGRSKFKEAREASLASSFSTGQIEQRSETPEALPFPAPLVPDTGPPIKAEGPASVPNTASPRRSSSAENPASSPENRPSTATIPCVKTTHSSKLAGVAKDSNSQKRKNGASSVTKPPVGKSQFSKEIIRAFGQSEIDRKLAEGKKPTIKDLDNFVEGVWLSGNQHNEIREWLDDQRRLMEARLYEQGQMKAYPVVQSTNIANVAEDEFWESVPNEVKEKYLAQCREEWSHVQRLCTDYDLFVEERAKESILNLGVANGYPPL